MIEAINISEILNKPNIRAIYEAANEQNVRVFVIGGWVRDFMLKRESTDMDFVVEGSGIELAKSVSTRLNAHLSVFKSFGTAMVNMNNDANEMEFEFVGARKESYRNNSRNPIVEDGTIEDDQNRRDFTINALAVELTDPQNNNIIDPFNGLEDLKNGIIRTPLDPDVTFSDDPLRIMRAIRFATQLNFKIEESTLKAIVRNRDRIKIITAERITTELNKIIMSPKPSIGFKIMFNTGLLDIIFPELSALQGVEKIGNKSHKDNFYHTLEVLDNICPYTDNLYLRWAALLHDIAKAPTKRFVKGIGWTFHGHEHAGSKMVPLIFKRFKMPMHDKMHYVQKLVKLHLRPIVLVEDSVSDSAVRRLLYEAGDDVDDLMTLCHADITSKNEKKVKRYHRNFNQVKAKLIEIEEKDKLRNWQPPIDGDAIMKIFGLEPCKTIGDLKKIVREAILEGEIENNYEAAYELMVESAAKIGLKPIQ
jgi:poly(A) polymerase